MNNCQTLKFNIVKKNISIKLLIALGIIFTISSCKNKGGNPEPQDEIFANFSFESNNDFHAPSEITFTDLSVFVDSTAVAEYLWYFADGTSSSTLQNPEHVFYKQGIYNVRLRVSIPDVETQEITIPVTIKPPYDIIFSEAFDDHNPDATKGADIPNTWVAIDNDGGTPFDTTLYTAAWKIITSDKMKSDVAVATSYYTSTPVPDADDWMISPAVQLTDTVKYTLLWRAMSLTESGNWPDSYQVYVSTTSQDISGCIDPINGKMINTTYHIE